MLREDEEDAIVDLSVGLEAALSDRSPTEMTHKLSLRVAALTARTECRDATTTFNQMKKIYGYRSAIVHGDNTAKARVIRGERGKEVPLLPIAIELLREVLIALVREPRWQKPAQVDGELLLGGTAEAGLRTADADRA